MARTLIVGASVAGVRTAQSLRAEGYDGEIVVVGAERELPYDKPELSKGLLQGLISEEQNLLISDQEAVDSRIELRLGVPATALDTNARLVELADGSSLDFDTLVIATGARARSSPWGELPGVHVLRSIADARALATDIRAGGHLVIIGGGFLGSEVASSAVKLGAIVDLIDPNSQPMARVVGPEVASIFEDLHTGNAVRTRFGIAVAGIEIDHDRSAPAGRPGLVVILDDNTRLAADTVLVCIGAVTNTEWLEDSGLEVSGGVTCDEFLRVVNSPDVLAVGDVLCWWDPVLGEHRRSEHWTSAVEQARVAAHNIAHPDDPRPFSLVEYFWSDQHDWRFQFAGRTGAASHVVVRHADEPPRFAVVYSADGERMTGVMTVNWPKALIVSRQMIVAEASLVEATARLEALVVSTPQELSKGASR